MIEFSHYSHPRLVSPMPCLLTRPDDSESERLPMIVFLHGAGERGDSREKLMTHGIAKYFGKDECAFGVRAITLSPQCPPDCTWNEFPTILYDLILSVAGQQNADPDRISITGLSMGGFGTWEMLSHYPDFFSVAAPICGGGMGWRIATKTPVRAFHGDVDSVVDIRYSYIMVDSLNRNGGHADLTVYHGCDHNCWDRAYETTDLVRWLVEAKRK